MSVSKDFVLDDDGRLLKITMQFNRLFKNIQKFTKLSRNGAHNLLSPLIRLINEKDNDTFKQIEGHTEVMKCLREAWLEERNFRERNEKFVRNIGEWMLDKGFSSVEELDEEWDAARLTECKMRRYKCIAKYNTIELEAARETEKYQTVKFEQVQKECDELKRRNRMLFQQLEVARSDIRKMTVHQKSKHKLFVSEKKRSSVGFSEYNAHSFEHIEKKTSSQVELKISDPEAEKTVPAGVKSEEEVCDLNVENGFLSNGQYENDTMVVREDSTDDKVDESVCMDIKEESAEGNVEESRVVLCSGEQKSDEFQRFRTESTHDNIKESKEIELVADTKRSNLKVYQNLENVQNKGIGFQNVIEKFDILENPSMDLKEQHHEISTVSELPRVIKGQRTVSEIMVETNSENSEEKEESNVQDKKANDLRESQGPPMRLLPKSSNLDQYENKNCVLFKSDTPNKDPILVSGKSPQLENQDRKKAGEGACGSVFETRTIHGVQEEPWPRKDPPPLFQSNDTIESQDNSDQVRVLLHRDFRPREDPPQPQMSQSKDKDQLKTCLHQEFRPRKDPPRMCLHDTRGYEFQPEKFEVHLHHEFRPRKDPPCRDHYHNMPPCHYGSNTDSWSNFVIDVH
ncbi:Protein CBG06474 [Caenorhabditis briggsae]|uniref:Protein CBG06474 n=1 Tax=Caenorhabditis briggsae TaxID=6238 RepID=A8X2B1_CAEBR|nr:Protein CBG06474 [Caenorhabditis briggsae]CAP26771.2 Protein CBG06474 [Caenorhabditis briggsae]